MSQALVLVFYNDTASQQLMSQYNSTAALAYSNSSYLIYLWTSTTQADADAANTLFNNSGSPGYPVGGLMLPPPKS